ncbi:hypothetical protein BOTBODRAFT_120107, partial [Botryobasidium botryosum FD-172 SS1]
YPTLFQMAMDYLPIMASAVPCERVLSTSAKTDIPRRSRISPSLMSALQFLKYKTKKSRLDFSVQYITTEDELMESLEYAERVAITLTSQGPSVAVEFLYHLLSDT